MNQMEIFKNPEFGSIRTFEQDDKVLFCGTDIAAALGYTNPRKAVRDHTRGGTKRSIGVQTGKKADGTPAVQMVEMLFIPEGDVYRLIVHSKLPSAERFERWVFDEVLPSIRKHGAYITREKLQPFLTCLSTSSRAPTSEPPPKNWLCRSAGLSASCWNSGLCTAPHPGMYCLMQNPPTTACSASRTTATMGIPAPIRW